MMPDITRQWSNRHINRFKTGILSRPRQRAASYQCNAPGSGVWTVHRPHSHAQSKKYQLCALCSSLIGSGVYAMVLKVFEPAASGNLLEMHFLSLTPDLLNQRNSVWFCKPSGWFSCIIKFEHCCFKETCEQRERTTLCGPHLCTSPFGMLASQWGPYSPSFFLGLGGPGFPSAPGIIQLLALRRFILNGTLLSFSPLVENVYIITLTDIS